LRVARQTNVILRGPELEFDNQAPGHASGPSPSALGQAAPTTADPAHELTGVRISVRVRMRAASG
jgi:hypothetical protein